MDSESSNDDISEYQESPPSSNSNQPTAFMTQQGGRSGEPISSAELHRQFATPQQKQEPGLIQSIRTDAISTVREALRSGCDVNSTDSSNRTALHVACAFGRLEIVKLLLSAGSHVDASSTSGKTALHEACIGGHCNVLKLLSSEVADLDAVDKKGMSAAHYCALNGEVDCLTLLCNQVRACCTIAQHNVMTI